MPVFSSCSCSKTLWLLISGRFVCAAWFFSLLFWSEACFVSIVKRNRLPSTGCWDAMPRSRAHLLLWLACYAKCVEQVSVMCTCATWRTPPVVGGGFRRRSGPHIHTRSGDVYFNVPILRDQLVKPGYGRVFFKCTRERKRFIYWSRLAKNLCIFTRIFLQALFTKLLLFWLILKMYQFADKFTQKKTELYIAIVWY